MFSASNFEIRWQRRIFTILCHIFYGLLPAMFSRQFVGQFYLTNPLEESSHWEPIVLSLVMKFCRLPECLFFGSQDVNTGSCSKPDEPFCSLILCFFKVYLFTLYVLVLKLCSLLLIYDINSWLDLLPLLSSLPSLSPAAPPPLPQLLVCDQELPTCRQPIGWTCEICKMFTHAAELDRCLPLTQW